MKKSYRKPRTLIVNFNLNRGSNIDIEFDAKVQKLVIKGVKNSNMKAIENINLITSYARPTKNKILNYIPLAVRQFQINPNDALVNNFSAIFACDTNYVGVGSLKICVTCLSVLRFLNEQYISDPICAIVFSMDAGEMINPERIGWAHFIDSISNSALFKSANAIALVIDSDLDDLDNLNSRIEPVFEQKFLKEKFTLIYGSTDTGKDLIANKLVSTADKAAKDLMNNILSQINLESIPSYKTPFELTRTLS
jgi:hypothetical protein